MHRPNCWIWSLIGVFLMAVGIISLLWNPAPVAAQTRSTPTREMPPPERTMPPSVRSTPTFTPSPETPAPVNPTLQPTFTPTPEPPVVMPPTGTVKPDSWLLLLAAAAIGLGVLALAWGVVGYRRSVLE